MQKFKIFSIIALLCVLLGGSSCNQQENLVPVGDGNPPVFGKAMQNNIASQDDMTPMAAGTYDLLPIIGTYVSNNSNFSGGNCSAATGGIVTMKSDAVSGNTLTIRFKMSAANTNLPSGIFYIKDGGYCGAVLAQYSVSGNPSSQTITVSLSSIPAQGQKIYYGMFITSGGMRYTAGYIRAARLTDYSSPIGWCTAGVRLAKGGTSNGTDVVGGVPWSGNASTWYTAANNKGYSVGGTPQLNAIVVWPGPSASGHTGIVTGQDAQGNWLYKAMNDNAGFNQWTYNRKISSFSGGTPSYIYY